MQAEKICRNVFFTSVAVLSVLSLHWRTEFQLWPDKFWNRHINSAPKIPLGVSVVCSFPFQGLQTSGIKRKRSSLVSAVFCSWAPLEHHDCTVFDDGLLWRFNDVCLNEPPVERNPCFDFTGSELPATKMQESAMWGRFPNPPLHTPQPSSPAVVSNCPGCRSLNRCVFPPDGIKMTPAQRSWPQRFVQVQF